MKKKAILLLALSALFPLCLSGCSDYRGIEELTIIAGVAVDIDENNDELFKLTFEIVDTRYSSDVEKRPAYLLETTGEDINTAVSRLSYKIQNQFSFSHVEIIVIGADVLRIHSLNDIVDAFMRDRGTRDNMMVLVSTDITAAKIFEGPNEGREDTVNVSFELNNSFLSDAKSLDGVKLLEIYEVYGQLSEAACAIMLPCLCVSTEDQPVVIYDGQAVIDKSGHYVGKLTEDELRMFLLADTARTAGAYSLTLEPDPETGERTYLSVVVRNTTPTKSFSFDGEKFTLRVDVKATVSAIEIGDGGELTGELVSDFQSRLSKEMSEEATASLSEARNRLGQDILRFAKVIRGHDPALWRRVSENWEGYYRDAELIVNCDVYMNSTGLMGNY